MIIKIIVKLLVIDKINRNLIMKLLINCINLVIKNKMKLLEIQVKDDNVIIFIIDYIVL